MIQGSALVVWQVAFLILLVCHSALEQNKEICFLSTSKMLKMKNVISPP